MDELAAVPDGGNCVADQVLYHLGSRGIEWQLLPKCRKAGIMVMAYSPLGQGPLLRKPALGKIASKHGCDPGAVALAWVLRQTGLITIPKATNPEHVRANIKAIDIELDADDLATLDTAFPPPKRAAPLEMT
jgi:diketogulonate reductase-like aldo/keto reductase